MNGMFTPVVELTSAAFQIGLQCLTTGMRRAVAACVPVSFVSLLVLIQALGIFQSAGS